jgi:hypothetical protein
MQQKKPFFLIRGIEKPLEDPHKLSQQPVNLKEFASRHLELSCWI